MMAPIRAFELMRQNKAFVDRLVRLVMFRAIVKVVAQIDDDEAARWADDGGR